MKFSNIFKSSSNAEKEKILPGDFVIVLLGPTGSGKSNFLSNASGNERHQKLVADAEKLESKTKKIQIAHIEHPNLQRRIVLVDTPGFNSAEAGLGESELMEKLTSKIGKKLPKVKPDAILYFHDATAFLPKASKIGNLSATMKMAGFSDSNSLKNVSLVTTMWDYVDGNHDEIDRLLQTHWSKMTDYGAGSARFENSHTSALDIISRLVPPCRPPIL